MKIHHFRNATFVIESGRSFILIDPMLGKKAELKQTLEKEGLLAKIHIPHDGESLTINAKE